MIFDLNEGAPEQAGAGYDACIAGAGVAGITLAGDLAARGRRVLLLEAGGLDFSAESQDVYRGENLGRAYFELDATRLRYFGGSSNHWAGWCRPLDARDFERHDHIPLSGWPIARTDLDPYLATAAEILEISPDFADAPLEDSGGALERITFHVSPPVFFGEKYRRELEESDRIVLVLNANLVDLRLSESGGRLAEAHCANYAEPEARHAFSAETFVLAMGGIENPRLLLNCRSQQPKGLGNAQDLVGRHFMEHFHVLGGHYVTEREIWPFGDQESHFAPSAAVLREKDIANASLRVGPLEGPGAHPDAFKRFVRGIVCSADVVSDFVNTFRRVDCPDQDFLGGYVYVVSEQAPNPESRVRLAAEEDRFGLRRTALDWRTSALDRRTVEATAAAFGRYLAERELGNLRLADWLQDPEAAIPGVTDSAWEGAGHHHMGTTRMAAAPEEGVVDGDCRVFGIDNLHIAGSSVFSTAGHANPTLAIVQLALRLGEHLDRRLG